ncbi:shikimate dehydrogenase [Legionella fairfieldensis]|uniref:shikimate dehydrogenase n=1 Tax=Legionella fairfieldensis TaxID=45064 RepID=UPI00048AB396|nr:shikimate dehydrogenase [Legionella fairfieldensis]
MIKRFAVMGNPVDHSLSPLIHQYFAAQAGIELHYDKLQMDNQQFESQVSSFFAEGGKGLNITSPFKQRAFTLTDSVTTRCARAKAANTLWLSAGQVYGDNTDGVGFIKDLSRYFDLKNQEVLLLGAGGAARGIIDPLLASGITQLTITNRTAEKLHHLQADYSTVKCVPLAELITSYDLIINATATDSSKEKLPLPSVILRPATFCYDLTYCLKNPTSFIQWANYHGKQAVDGLGMLVEQAAESFFIWHDYKPETIPVIRQLTKSRQ